MQPRTRRRVAIATGTAAGLTAAALLAGTVLLPDLVEARAEAALRAAGFADAAVELDRIDLGGAEAAVRLAGDQGIDRATIEYTPGQLRQGRVGRVILEGLRLELEATGDGLRIVGREAAERPAEGPLIPDLPVESIELRRASIAMETPAGTVSAPLDGTLVRTAPGTYRISGTAQVEMLRAVGIATMEGRFTPEMGLEAAIVLDPPAGPEAAGLGALAGQLRLTLTPGQPPGGQAALRLNNLEVPVAGQVSGELDWRSAGGSHGINATLTAQHGLAARFVAAVEPQEGGPALAAVDGALDAPDLKALSALFDLDIPITGQATAKLNASGPIEGALPPIRTELRIERAAWDGQIADATVRAVGRVMVGDGTLKFESEEEIFAEAKPGKALLDMAPDFFAAGPLSLSLRPPVDGQPLAVSLASAEGKRRLELAGRIGLEAGALALGGLVPEAALSLDEGGALAGGLHLAEAALDAPAYAVSARGADLRLDYQRGRTEPLVAKLTAASLRAGPDRGWVAPLAVTAELAGHPFGQMSLKASGEAADGALVIDLAARHDMNGGAGSGQLILHPVRFTEGVRAPADLFPVLADQVESANGRVGLRLRHAWGPKAPPGRGELLLEDLSLVGPGIAVRGLNGVLVANSLIPLRTPPDQLISVALLNVGVPLSDGLIRFAVGEGERLVVDQARFTWADGTVLAQPFALPLRDPAGTVVLEAAGLHLGRVLALAGVDGLAATGNLEGRIPVIIRGDALRFEGGMLAATGEGLIRYDPAVPPSFLDPSRNENTALVMQVLQNFRYNELAVTIDGTVGGEMAVALKLRGSNPDFYGGYPVALNLNLSGALDSILRSGLGTYRIPDEVRARIEQYQKAAQ